MMRRSIRSSFPARAAACALSLLVLAARVSAQTTPPDKAAAQPNSALPDLSWVPPDDTFDWVQLKSGEWLKGRAKAMQDDELEFDSEELDNRTFDWEDIRQIRTGQGHTVEIKFVDGELLTGRIAITPTQVVVTGAEQRTVPRDQLQSFTRGGKKELDYWSGKVSLGLTVRSGNTDQTDYNGQANFSRRTPSTRLRLDYIGNISKTAQVEDTNNHRANVQFDVWFSKRFYLIAPFVEYFTDRFQNIDRRISGGAGVGYYIIDRKKMEWTISAGPGYQQTYFVSSQPGEPTEKGSAVLAVGTRFDWDITSTLEWMVEYRGQFSSKEAGETTQHATTTFSVDLTKRLDFDVSFVWDRINNPKVGADGVQPKPDDYRLVVGLGLDF